MERPGSGLAQSVHSSIAREVNPRDLGKAQTLIFVIDNHEFFSPLYAKSGAISRLPTFLGLFLSTFFVPSRDSSLNYLSQPPHQSSLTARRIRPLCVHRRFSIHNPKFHTFAQSLQWLLRSYVPSHNERCEMRRMKMFSW